MRIKNVHYYYYYYCDDQSFIQNHNSTMNMLKCSPDAFLNESLNVMIIRKFSQPMYDKLKFLSLR